MPRLPNVDRYMTVIPYTIDPDMTVRVALELMRRHGVRHLPVEQGEKIVGILSVWDILSASKSGAVELALEKKVSELMTPDPVSVTPHVPLEQVIALMDREGIGSVLVAQDGEIIGILTEKDIVHAFAGIYPFPAEPRPPLQ